MKEIITSISQVLHKWVNHFVRSITDEKGYLVITSILGIYLTIYSIVQAKSDRDMNYASNQLSNFMALTSGNKPALLANLRNFSSIQNIDANVDPSILDPLKWHEKYKPNKQFLSDWAFEFFKQCSNTECGDEQYRVNLEEVEYYNANLIGVDFHNSNISHGSLNSSDLRESNLSFSNLSHVSFQYTQLASSDIKNSNLNGSNLSGADLKTYGSDYSRPTNLSYSKMKGTNLHSATFSYAVMLDVDLSTNNSEYSSTNTDLTDTDFSFANLKGTNFTGAIAINTNFSNSNLSNANLSFSQHKNINLSNAKYNKNTIFPSDINPTKNQMILSQE